MLHVGSVKILLRLVRFNRCTPNCASRLATALLSALVENPRQRRQTQSHYERTDRKRPSSRLSARRRVSNFQAIPKNPFMQTSSFDPVLGHCYSLP